MWNSLGHYVISSLNRWSSCERLFLATRSTPWINYIRFGVLLRFATFSILSRSLQLIHVGKLSASARYQLFPSIEMLNALNRDFGVPLTEKEMKCKRNDSRLDHTFLFQYSPRMIDLRPPRWSFQMPIHPNCAITTLLLRWNRVFHPHLKRSNRARRTSCRRTSNRFIWQVGKSSRSTSSSETKEFVWWIGEGE